MKAVERRESGDGWMRLDADEHTRTLSIRPSRRPRREAGGPGPHDHALGGGEGQDEAGGQTRGDGP